MEFALIAPIMIVMTLAIIDLARIYTTMLTVESAAREAADYGTFGSQRWDPSFYDVAALGTKAQMHRRACIAAKNLSDYVGPDTACTNPTFSFELSGDRGLTWTTPNPPNAEVDALVCNDPVRPPPCWVKVTLHHEFSLIAPFNFEMFGTRFGLPSTIGFDRISIFPMTDLNELP